MKINKKKTKKCSNIEFVAHINCEIMCESELAKHKTLGWMFFAVHNIQSQFWSLYKNCPSKTEWETMEVVHGGNIFWWFFHIHYNVKTFIVMSHVWPALVCIIIFCIYFNKQESNENWKERDQKIEKQTINNKSRAQY